MTATPIERCSLRPFVPDDIASVAAIEALVSPEPWSASLFAGEFDVSAAARHWLVAERDGSILGFGGMMFVADEGHLMNIAVHPDHQRQHIAHQLCEALFDDARSRGVASLTLEVRVSNTAALGLYRRFGFQPVGSRKAYYANGDGSREDGLILWLHDVGSRTFEATP